MNADLVDIPELLDRLARSSFRRRFRLSGRECDYLDRKGWPVIERHAREFVEKRLAPARPANDGRQTPWKNHPVFVAQHATATCCRGCLQRWCKIPKGRALTAAEIDFVVRLILGWLARAKHLENGPTETVPNSRGGIFLFDFIGKTDNHNHVP